jgi:nicotinamide-nucleotide amidase
VPNNASVDDALAAALLARSQTIATCESCTGGLVASRLTDRPGSSAYVLGGLVTYSNEAKTDLAGVPAELIERFGAVSPEIAEAMARGAREALGADIGISTTGIAGPDGGSADKPVGLVYLCAVGPQGTLARKLNLDGDRAQIRTTTVEVALDMLLELLGEHVS